MFTPSLFFSRVCSPPASAEPLSPYVVGARSVTDASLLRRPLAPSPKNERRDIKKCLEKGSRTGTQWLNDGAACTHANEHTNKRRPRLPRYLCQWGGSRKWRRQPEANSDARVRNLEVARGRVEGCGSASASLLVRF